MIQKNLDKWQKYWHNVKHNTTNYILFYNLIGKALNGNKVAEFTESRETAGGASRNGTVMILAREPRF